MSWFRRVACWVGLGLGVLGPPGPATAQARAPITAVVEQYRQARARTMDAGATDADVTAATALLADSVVYEHPAAGARRVGRATLTEGMRSFLGRTRNPSIRVVRQITGRGVVVAEEQVSFEASREDGGWERSTRTQVAVYEVRDGHITRIIEYWQPG
jgi:ketosteroid isomerase-like protein